MEARRPTAADGGAAGGAACRSVLTIAFQFTFEAHVRDHVAAMARQYVRNVVASVQRVAMAIAPSLVGPRLGLKPGCSPEALTLAQWICRSYKLSTGVDLLKSNPSAAGESLLKLLWQYPDAVICCSLKISVSFLDHNISFL